PFGFFEKSRELSLPGELIIYPAVDPVGLPAWESKHAHTGDGHLDRGRGYEVLSVRPLREGDDVRDIYWRKSANQLIVRERAKETRRDITLTLDNLSAAPSAPWLEQFEQRIRDVASRAVAHIRRGDAVTVLTTSRERARADRAVGADPVLRFLALLTPQKAPLPGGAGGPNP